MADPTAARKATDGRPATKPRIPQPASATPNSSTRPDSSGSMTEGWLSRRQDSLQKHYKRMAGDGSPVKSGVREIETAREPKKLSKQVVAAAADEQQNGQPSKTANLIGKSKPESGQSNPLPAASGKHPGTSKSPRHIRTSKETTRSAKDTMSILGDGIEGLIEVANVLDAAALPHTLIDNDWIRLVYTRRISLFDPYGWSDAEAIEDLAQLRHRIIALKTEVDDEKKRNVDLQTSLTKKEVEVDDEKKRNADLHTSLIKKEVEVTKWKKNQQTVLKSQRQIRDELQKDYEQKVEGLRNENQAMFEQTVETFASARLEKDELTNERDLLVKDATKMTGERDILLEVTTKNNEVTAATISSMASQIKELETQDGANQEDHQNHIMHLQANISQLEVENRFLISYRKLQSDSGQFGTFYLNQSADRGKQIAELQHENDELKRVIATKLSNEQDHKDTIVQYQKREKKSQADLNALKGDVAALKQEKDSVQKTVDQFAAPLAQFRKKMQKIEAHLAPDSPFIDKSAIEDAKFAADAFTLVLASAERLEAERVKLQHAEEKIKKLENQLCVRAMEEESLKADASRAREEAQQISMIFTKQQHELTQYKAIIAGPHSNAIAHGINQRTLFQLDQANYQVQATRTRCIELQQANDSLTKLVGDIGDWYYNDQCNIVPSLHKRIAELMAEKGEVYIVEQPDHPNPNVQIDKLFRVASLRGHWDEKNPTPRPYDPNANPGCIPATFEALKKLLPLGWQAFYGMDRMWLKPMLEPFTKEDALERLEAQKQDLRRELCAKFEVTEEDIGRVAVDADGRTLLVELPCNLGLGDVETKQIDLLPEPEDDPTAPVEVYNEALDPEDVLAVAQERLDRFHARFDNTQL